MDNYTNVYAKKENEQFLLANFSKFIYFRIREKTEGEKKWKSDI